jgi:hypothetical protein
MSTDWGAETVDRNQLALLLHQLVSGGSGLEAAVRNLKMLGPPPAELEAAVSLYEREIRRIRELKEPRVIEDEDIHTGWYAGPQDNHVFWPSLRKLLAQTIREEDLHDVHDASSKVVSYLDPPGAQAIRTRGLVIGFVQSGKTTNFMSVIAKAADVGYRLFIVLSGIHDSLREQTQSRLRQMLVDPTEKQWFLLTDESDFSDPGNPNFLLGHPSNRILGVVKKNPARLQRLNEWLDGAAKETLRSCPILVIDDEADQASIDVGTDEQRSRINRLVVRLLQRPKAAYVGYTASPFANLLIDPTDPANLYPRDFVVDLPKPGHYYGTDRIFGREPLSPDEPESISEGLDVVRVVPEEEVAELRPPARKEARQAWVPSVTPTLREALRYFTLATAARRVRSYGTPHSSMLIHTTVRVDAQNQLADPVRAELEALQSALAEGDGSTVADLREQWETEQKRLPSTEVGLEPVPFDDLARHLPEVLGAVKVTVDNYTWPRVDRLHYEEDRPSTVVAIGGNTLSRGLTLEGLVTSFFVRSASAYDTLLQMGRWFGYRQGYEDLPRIWMTPQLTDWFFWLGTVEQEIRLDARRYETERVTPREFAVRIRTHPKLAVTSALKMRKAVTAHVSYGDRRLQTILFNHRDAAWLAGNWRAGADLVRRVLAAGLTPTPTSQAGGRTVIKGVPVAMVLDFLDAYTFHEENFDLQEAPLRAYILGQNSHRSLLTWNIAVMGVRPGRGTAPLGLPERVGLINRSRLELEGIPHANIKALMSKVDRVVDLDVDPRTLASADDEDLVRLRNQHAPEVGSLLLYPIAADSRPDQPRRGRQRRAPLDGVGGVLGVGLVFPAAVGAFTSYEYVTADLSAVEHEEIELSPEEQLELQGQLPEETAL